LHYGTLLGSRACAHMAAAAWASGFLYSLLHTANTFSLPLCHGNALGQFFCEIPQILKLSCSKSYLRELGLIAVCVCLVFGCFVFIVFSYVQIFRAVLRIPSEQGRYKAFSTCLPHLAVVSLFVSTAAFAYLKPHSISSPSLDLTLSILYSVVPPLGVGAATQTVEDFDPVGCAEARTPEPPQRPDSPSEGGEYVRTFWQGLAQEARNAAIISDPEAVDKNAPPHMRLKMVLE
ncbi:olfactory receptor 14J1-like, partial [Melospiza melodia melodia]|uniref:olfactory receptor 14J1-like n=1 Tax=Melospiza melodia melodia TaxID=1914991 RepID=UPI002FD0A973